jgi:hypothetical protein
MKTLVAACVTTLVLSVAGTAAVFDFLAGRDQPSEHLIFSALPSAALNEQREVIVHLPESYHRDPERRYPVVYVLDGSSLDTPTADSAALMSRIGLMPELIVVGVPNVSGEGRQRDYTPPFMAQDVDVADSPKGKADAFLAFVEQELIPAIERDYRTDRPRMLAGHSRGGLLVTYSLLARPGLFDVRFAHSPALWREDGIVVSKLEEFLRSKPSLGGFLYLSMGSEEVDRMMSGFLQACGVLEQSAAATGLRWHADVVPGANHQTNGAMATPLGFKAAFAGSQPSAVSRQQ